MSAKEVDQSADVYSLGIVAFQMLAGEVPFKGSNAGQILYGHLQKPVPDPREFVPELPPSIAQTLRKALSKAPEDRYPTAGALVAALQPSEEADNGAQV
jgi:serine/threonine-protein kinase